MKTGYNAKGVKSLFTSHLDPDNTGLQVSDAFVTVKSGKASRIHISVSKPTQHDVILHTKTEIGLLQTVCSVVHLVVQLDCVDTGSDSHNHSKSVKGNADEKPWDPLDDRLSNEQQHMVRELLWEESGTFSKMEMI